MRNSEKGNYDYLMGADLDTDNPEVIQETRNWGKWYQDTVHMDKKRKCSGTSNRESARPVASR